MTVLSVIQDACMGIGLTRPLAVFGSTDREWQEMQRVANEAASVIVQAFDWQKLKRLHILTGDGVSGSFPLPDDYRRMLKKGAVWSSRFRWKTTHIVDLDDWLELTTFDAPVADGIWTIYGGQFHYQPIAMPSEALRFFYITDEIVKASPTDPGMKRAFTNDDDTFLVNERLLKLAIIYLWKQSKSLDFAAELADYEQAIDQYMIEDKGSQPVVSGNATMRPSSNVWPGRVSG